MRNVIWITLAVSILLLIPTESVSAGYVDPGSGSYFIQILAAGLFGLFFVLKGYWSRIRTLFGKSSQRATSNSGGHHSGSPERDSSE
jgi:hypothetical protein